MWLRGSVSVFDPGVSTIGCGSRANAGTLSDAAVPQGGCGFRANAGTLFNAAATISFARIARTLFKTRL